MSTEKGRSPEMATPGMMERVHEKVMNDRLAATRHVAKRLGVSFDSLQLILTDKWTW